MILHAYETTALQEGADCAWCAAPFPLGGTHYENPADPGRDFCRPGCAESYAERERRKGTSQPGQVGLAL